MNSIAANPTVGQDASMQIAERQVLGLSTLLQLGQEARAAKDVQALAYLVVNESQRLVAYDQAILVIDGKVLAVSGLSQPDRHSNLLRGVTAVVKALVAKGDTASALVSDLGTLVESDEQRQALQPLQASQLLWVPWSRTVDDKTSLAGGLLVQRSNTWADNEQALIAALSDVYAHALQGLTRASIFSRLRHRLASKWLWLVATLVLVAAMWLPVPLTALAPAQVAARDPVLIASPYDGVLAQFAVPPNATVKKGDLLFTMDDTDVRNSAVIAERALAVAQADYERALKQRLAGSGLEDSSDVKAQVALLQEEVERKRAELQYNQELMQRIQVRAPIDGIAIYSDPNDWIGKPLRIGERVMQVAATGNAELLLHLPVDDAITFAPASRVVMFLNVSPLQPLEAQVRHTSFEAAPTPEGALAYKVRASFTDDVEALPRIGLKGTARIHGEQVSLFYYLFRKPISAVRRTLGL
jgi:uncharacterized small protein (DUF1192 family)